MWYLILVNLYEVFSLRHRAKCLGGFPCGSASKENTCNAGELGSIPGLGRSPGEVKGYPLQYSGLENSMDCIVHGVTKSRTQLSNFHFHLNVWGGGINQTRDHEGEKE